MTHLANVAHCQPTGEKHQCRYLPTCFINVCLGYPRASIRKDLVVLLGAAHGLLGTSRNEPVRRTCPKQSMSQERPHVVLVIDLAGTMVHGKVQTSPSL